MGGDSNRARAGLDGDDAIDALQDRVIEAALTAIRDQPGSAPQRIDVIMIAKNLRAGRRPRHQHCGGR